MNKSNYPIFFLFISIMLYFFIGISINFVFNNFVRFQSSFISDNNNICIHLLFYFLSYLIMCLFSHLTIFNTYIIVKFLVNKNNLISYINLLDINQYSINNNTVRSISYVNNSYAEYIRLIYLNIFPAIFELLIVYFSVLKINFRIGFFILMFQIFTLLLYLFLHSCCKELFENHKKVKTNMEYHLDSTITGIWYLKVYQNIFKKMSDKMMHLSTEYILTKKKLHLYSNIIQSLINIIFLLFIFYTLYFIPKNISSSYNRLLITNYMLYITRIQNRVTNIITIFSDVFMNKFSFKYDKEDKDGCNINYINSINFKYLKNNIIIKRGIINTLNGPTGSGKSYIVKQMCGLFRGKSGIYFNNMHISNISLFSIRKNTAYLFQDYFLFEGSIKSNIIMSLDKDIDTIRYNKVIDYLNIENYFLSKNININHNINFNILSGGQKQLICIARLLYKALSLSVSLIIFDEPFNHLDKNITLIIINIINLLKKENKFILVIDHQLKLQD